MFAFCWSSLAAHHQHIEVSFNSQDGVFGPLWTKIQNISGLVCRKSRCVRCPMQDRRYDACISHDHWSAMFAPGILFTKYRTTLFLIHGCTRPQKYGFRNLSSSFLLHGIKYGLCLRHRLPCFISRFKKFDQIFCCKTGKWVTGIDEREILLRVSLLLVVQV